MVHSLLPAETKVTATFFRFYIGITFYTSKVSRGVNNIPGYLQPAISHIPFGKSLTYFGLLLASWVFFVFIAFTIFLPVIVPQKFALCFTVGCRFRIR
ncbi:putative vesicle transport protein SFT2 [Helianthus annuus]|uniref:Vesicle transport protein n=1 Tax=Helianthus annuus TaxID=4232 RepID=A0A9K3HYP1_HELAN|nr:putative vesicle transport protein SFT2 [Helianthus annuus]